MTARELLGGTTVPNPATREAIAHHEAGHAVVAVAVGYRVGRVTIVPDAADGSLGMVNWRGLEAGHMEEFARAAESGDPMRRWMGRCGAITRARTALAGPIAEGIYTGSHRWRPWSSPVWPEKLPSRPYPMGFYDDEVNAIVATVIAACDTTALFGYQMRAGREVRRYLTGVWPVVQDVAALLLRKGTVDGDAADGAVRRSSERRGLNLYAPEVIAPWWKAPARGRRGGAEVSP